MARREPPFGEEVERASGQNSHSAAARLVVVRMRTTVCGGPRCIVGHRESGSIQFAYDVRSFFVMDPIVFCRGKEVGFSHALGRSRTAAFRVGGRPCRRKFTRRLLAPRSRPQSAHRLPQDYCRGRQSDTSARTRQPYRALSLPQVSLPDARIQEIGASSLHTH